MAQFTDTCIPTGLKGSKANIIPKVDFKRVFPRMKPTEFCEFNWLIAAQEFHMASYMLVNIVSGDRQRSETLKALIL